jgi:hypothetical protein
MVNVATAFTPIASLMGGALIGLAAVMLAHRHPCGSSLTCALVRLHIRTPELQTITPLKDVDAIVDYLVSIRGAHPAGGRRVALVVKRKQTSHRRRAA